MPYERNADIPKAVRDVLPAAAQTIWRKAFNSIEEQTGDEAKAAAGAWAAVRRAGYVKNERTGKWSKVGKEFGIAKVDEFQNLVFGWASVSITKDGKTVVDSQEDIIEPDELETAAYAFNLQFRKTGEMHQGEAKGELVESFVVTPEKLEKMGLPRDALPIGWWVGFHIPDDEVFAKVRSGAYSMFSIQGRAIREEV